jgi:hypothetical protein
MAKEGRRAIEGNGPGPSVSLDGLEVNPELGYKVHPFADAFPMMEGAEFDELVEDIRAHGLQERIGHVWHNDEHIVVDGRNRLKACLAAGCKPEFKWAEINADDDEGILGYVWGKNVHRRQLTASQRAILATEHQKFINQIYKTSAQRRKATQGRPKKGAKKTAGNVASSLKTADILAKTAKVSPRTIKDALAVKKSGNEKLIAEVREGKTSVSKAAKQVRRKKAPAAKERPRPILFGKLANDWGKILRRHEKREAEAVQSLVERARFGMGESHRYEIRRAAKMIGLHMQHLEKLQASIERAADLIRTEDLDATESSERDDPVVVAIAPARRAQRLGAQEVRMKKTRRLPPKPKPIDRVCEQIRQWSEKVDGQAEQRYGKWFDAYRFADDDDGSVVETVETINELNRLAGSIVSYAKRMKDQVRP